MRGHGLIARQAGEAANVVGSVQAVSGLGYRRQGVLLATIRLRVEMAGKEKGSPRAALLSAYNV